ncbi:MAG: DNA (cytosine-5-)-methyltransferase [Clostridia bacterium]|nr:DNA (cytosine-5-)-methyltransferase [Clostridia bacterium]
MTIGSLFSGIGGIDLGFQQAGFDILWAIDFDKNACATYKANFPNVELLEENIKNVNAESLKNVDVIAAGFPCQSFSVCGNQAGFQDSRGHLFFEIMRIADTVKPKIIFLENVANLVEHDKGRTFNVIHNELIKRNYCVRYNVVDACDYGIPQHRTRTYIVAFLNELHCERYQFPPKCTLDKTIFNIIDKTKKEDGIYYLPADSQQYKQLNSFITDTNQIYRFTDYGIQSSKNGISFTLKANMGTWYNRIPFVKDNYGIRKITPYECLLIMGFPQSFRIGNIPANSAYKQIGNSVCVPIIKSIAKQILVSAV